MATRRTTKSIENGGERVGRLLIETLLLSNAHRSDANRTAVKEQIAANDAVIHTFVAQPHTRSEISSYNDYKALHDYLSRGSVIHRLYHAEAQSAFWKLISLVNEICILCIGAGQEPPRPTIITQSAYQAALDTGEPISHLFPYGVAVLATDPDPFSDRISADGRISISLRAIEDLDGIRRFVAEHAPFVNQSHKAISVKLRECFVIQEAFAAVSAFTGIPEINSLLEDVSSEAEMMSFTQARTYKPIISFASEAERKTVSTDSITALLKEILIPIEPCALKPSRKAVGTARKKISFDIAKGNSETIYSILRGGAAIE